MIKAGAIDKGMALLIKGQPYIVVEREFVNPGKGSAFTVRIPFKKPLGEAIQSEEPSQTRPRQQAKDQKIILVAEDEISNYMLVETLLASLPIKLIHVTNGEDAVAACRENSGIGLVLMDIKMPIMGGLEATRIIKKEKPELKIIALTAYAQKGDREKALAAGCDDYLAKPIRNQDLLDMVNTQL